MPICLDHPYTDLSGGDWLRGNLHTHTTASDGSRPAQQVIDDYAARGYGFLMISDHDIHTGPDDHAKLDAKGMILVPGNEVSKNGPHILHVGGDARVEPDALRQRVINDIHACADSSGGSFAIVNHPNWGPTFNHCALEKMQEWIGYAGMEIYNGTIGRLQGSPYATNKWDMLLTTGRRVWGFANDDSHLPVDDVALGWNVAYVTDQTWRGVVAALRAGRFYASTGVAITSIEVDGPRIAIETEGARRVTALCENGRRFAQADASRIEVEVPQESAYARFECWGDGESFAWTQPFFVVRA